MHKYIATPSRTAEIMEQHQLKMKKSLGQNFLIEPQILEKMMQAAHIDKETTVIEIGPGIGALTEFLAIHAKEVLAFEIDERFIDILADTLSPYSNVKVIHQDILEVDFEEAAYASLKEASSLVVVANLPYYITTPIIMKLVESDLLFDAMVMMMQKEVAQRFTASKGTKDYGSLTLAIERTMESELAFIVPPTVFIPRPRVASAVLVLKRRTEPLVEVADPEAFHAFIQDSFKQRRKTLWNNVRRSELPWLENRELTALEAAFQEAGVDPSRRAESLDIYEFAALYKALT